MSMSCTQDGTRRRYSKTMRPIPIARGAVSCPVTHSHVSFSPLAGSLICTVLWVSVTTKYHACIIHTQVLKRLCQGGRAAYANESPLVRPGYPPTRPGSVEEVTTYRIGTLALLAALWRDSTSESFFCGRPSSSSLLCTVDTPHLSPACDTHAIPRAFVSGASRRDLQVPGRAQ